MLATQPRSGAVGIGVMKPFDTYIERPPLPSPPCTSKPKPNAAAAAAPRLQDASNRAAQSQRELAALARQFSCLIPSKISRFSNSSLAAWTRRGSGFTPPSLIWTNHLQQDLFSIAHEADLPHSTASAVVAAARSGAVSCNPGVILMQLLQLQPIQELLGRRPLLQVLRHMPAVLNHDPEILAMNIKSLTPAFGKLQFTQMLAKCPRLLISSPFTVWGNLLALSELTGVALEEASVLFARQPRLLVNSPTALRQRFGMLGQLVGLPETGVQRLVRQQPALLSYFPETLAGNMMSMVQALGLSLESCNRLVERQPSLLMLCSSSLRAKVEALEELLGASAQKPIHLVIQKQPSVLTQSTESLLAKKERLQELLGLTQEEARVLLLSQPVLLTLSSAALATKLSSLRSAAAVRPEWQAQLEAARPNTLAAWLCFSKDRHQRFQVVAQTQGRGAGQGFAAQSNGSSSPLSASPEVPSGILVSAGPPSQKVSGVAVHASQKIPSLPKVLKMQDAAFLAMFTSIPGIPAPAPEAAPSGV